MLYLNSHIELFDEERTLQVCSLLPQWRREQALRFRHLTGKRECTLAYIELLRGLRLEYGIEEMPTFDYNEHGKPFLPAHPNIHFSLSHCALAVGCLIEEEPCGLDVERIRPATESLVRYCMSEEEVDEIFSSPRPDVSFTRLWTRKEAVFKQQGTGIRDNIKTLLKESLEQGLIIETTEVPWEGYIFSTCKRGS